MPLRVRAGRLGLAAALFAACAPRSQPAPVPAPVSAAAPSATAARRTASVPNDLRWFRASAERRAAYVQAYRLAEARVAELSAGRAAGTWAVIVDADETVLDNSAYQQERAAVDSGFSEASWAAWVARRAATALPGSVAFIAAVHARGGWVVVVTNRAEEACDATRDNLRRVGLAADVVLCRTTTDDKNPRFAAVAAGTGGLPPLHVVLWVGDNIQDFPALTQAGLRGAPDRAFDDFGRRFVVLPNPMYGSWERNPLP